MPAARRYDAVAIVLHWVIATAIAVQVIVGIRMTRAGLPPVRQFALFQLHKSVGVTILLAVVLRLAWRLAHRPPPLPVMPALERRAAFATHRALYALMLALPLSGWAVVSASPLNLPTLLFGVVRWPHLPVLATLTDKAPVEAIFQQAHAILGWVLIGLVTLHVAAAARHGWRGDGVLRRMLPWAVMTAVALLLAQAAVAATWVIDPKASTIGFSGVQVGQPFQGRFTRFNGTVVFDPARPETGSADVVIDLGSAETGDTQRDAALPQSDWFDIGRFPRATIHVGAFRPTAAKSFDGRAMLALRGVTASVPLSFTLAIDGTTAHANGHAALDRGRFGVGQGPWATGQWVGLAVDVSIDIIARQR